MPAHGHNSTFKMLASAEVNPVTNCHNLTINIPFLIFFVTFL